MPVRLHNFDLKVFKVFSRQILYRCIKLQWRSDVLEKTVSANLQRQSSLILLLSQYVKIPYSLIPVNHLLLNPDYAALAAAWAFA